MASKPKWTKSHWRVNLLGLLHSLLHFVLFCQVIAVSEVFRVWLKLPDDEFALLHSLSKQICRWLQVLQQQGVIKPDRTAERGLLEHSHWQLVMTTNYPEFSPRMLQSFHQVVCVTVLWSHTFHEKFVYTDQYTKYAGIQRFQFTFS